VHLRYDYIQRETFPIDMEAEERGQFSGCRFQTDERKKAVEDRAQIRSNQQEGVVESSPKGQAGRRPSPQQCLR